MESIYKTYLPKGFHNVNAYLFAADPETLISFLKEAFSAEEKNRSINEKTGDISNCIMQLGDSSIMIAQARGKYAEMKTAFYLFVSDVDQVYKKALECGARDEMEPMDMPYGDRQAGVVDPAGNIWWISMRLNADDY